MKSKQFSILPFSVVICIFLFILLFSINFSGIDAGPGIADNSGKYAVLTVDESLNDRLVRQSLAEIGDFISESSQTVMIDDFGSIKMIPLDFYFNEVEFFDPRNDGYAAKLRAFFVRDGKRFFFLPLGKGISLREANLKKQLGLILGETDFTFTVLGKKNPFFWHFLIFAAACGAVFFLSRSRPLFIFQLPLLLTLGWFSSSAFVLAAVLTGIWELLREPLGELYAGRYYARNIFNSRPALNLDSSKTKDEPRPVRASAECSGSRGLLDRLNPYRLNMVLVFILLVFFVSFFIVRELSLAFPAAALFCFFLLYFCSFKIKTLRSRKIRHITFTPVLLLPFKSKSFSFFPLLMPFGTGALLVLLVSFLSPEIITPKENGPLMDPEYLVSAADYEKHLDFQRSFSYVSLNDEPLLEEKFLRYYLGEDGLITGASENKYYETGKDSIADHQTIDPPFPLEKLMDFLVDYSKPGDKGMRLDTPERISGGQTLPDYSLLKIKEWISVTIIFAICCLDLIQSRHNGRRKKRIPVYGEKRIAA